MERLFRPASVAVIGGGSWCANVIRECQRIGFAGAIWPVHPHRTEVAGLPAFAALADLPHAPDCAFVGVNRTATIDVVRDLAQMGAGGAVCFASGFSEAVAEMADGTDLQQALIAGAGDMPLLGPNCYGFINALDGAALWPDQHGAQRVERGVAIVTQSSNIALNLTMQRRGLPLAYVVTVGNQAQTGLAAVGAALLEDPRVTALGLHIEGVGDLRALEVLAATARRLGKRIVALKVGASDQARAAAVSHTASLAGGAAAAAALLARLGVAQVDSLPVLLEALKLLQVAGPMRSRRIASLSCSGGEASLMADAALAAGMEFPPLSSTQEEALREALGPKVALSNPLDYHTYIWGDRPALARCFAAMRDPGLAMTCVVLDFPRSDRCTDAEWAMVAEALAEVAEADRSAPVALVASLPETMPEAIAEAAVAGGIVPFCGINEALAAMAAVADAGNAHSDPQPLWLPCPDPAGSHVLTEAQAKTALARHGLAVPRSLRMPAALAPAAALTIGFPVVLKAEGVAHKTEAGAVALNLGDVAAVADAVQQMDARDYLVEKQICGAVAELLVGVTRDAAHGYALTLGAGGVLTELWRDSVTLLLPVDAEAIRGALQGLRIAPMLAGHRGKPAASIDAIVAAVLAVQDYVGATPGVEEVEINPLLCTPTRAVAADALIRKGGTA